MSFEFAGAGPRKLLLCRYGASKLDCRGPERTPESPYFAFLGGDQTFGKFVRYPFADLIERKLGQACINLGCVNGGLDAIMGDADLLAIAGKAERTVVQLMDAQNLMNRFYRVHPRRNDRFIGPSPELLRLFPDTDFSEINFTRHLVSRLRGVSQDRFEIVADELKQTWQRRMRRLVDRLQGQVVLLWLRDATGDTGFGRITCPNLVDAAMIDRLRPRVTDVAEVSVKLAGASGDMDDMVFSSVQAPAAANMIGPAAHRKIADAVVNILRA